ncbi:MAG: hypothetical protein AAF496_08625 [Pseudomonadota bacterium]
MNEQSLKISRRIAWTKVPKALKGTRAGLFFLLAEVERMSMKSANAAGLDDTTSNRSQSPARINAGPLTLVDEFRFY